MNNWTHGFGQQSGGNFAPRVEYLLCKNSSGETIPAYGAMKATYNHTNNVFDVSML